MKTRRAPWDYERAILVDNKEYPYPICPNCGQATIPGVRTAAHCGSCGEVPLIMVDWDSAQMIREYIQVVSGDCTCSPDDRVPACASCRARAELTEIPY